MFAWHTSPSFGSLALTEKRILDGRRNGKAHSACAPHQKAHSACGRSRTLRLSVTSRPQNASFRECPQLECAFPHLGKRRATSRKSAFCLRHLTEKRILDRDRSARLRRAPSRRIPIFLLSGAACHPSEVLQASSSRGWTHSARRRLQTRGPHASFQPLSIVQPQVGSSPQRPADLSPRHETSQDN